jgi:hypothetical protein
MRLLALLLPLAVFAQETPEALARRFVTDVWIGGNADKAAAYLTDPYVVTDPRLGVNVRDPVSRQVERARQWCVVHNDCSASTIDSAIASGDRVALFCVSLRRRCGRRRSPVCSATCLRPAALSPSSR